MDAAPTTPSIRELTRVSARIGLLSFGGPAGQIALMHHEMVEKRGWLDEAHYLHALNFCHLLPGPEAQQLATYIGWRLHGVRGGLIAGLLFIIPGALVILALSMLYAVAANLGWFNAAFLGIKAAVLAIVAQALLRIAGRALQTSCKRWVAALAFVALAVFNLPFPLIILTAGIAGAVVAQTRPDWLMLKPHGAGADIAPRPKIAASLRTIALWLAIWAVPMVLVLAILGPNHIFWQIGVFFSKLAVVTFGGAYAVLAYMAQDIVQNYGWLQAREMADGLGLAETTPGPLILVTQFVGFLAAYRDAAPFSPMVAGILAALLTTWVTFAPCFLWIFTFAPWIDRLRNAARLSGALATITAAVVGVIANLTLWFALHVLFREVGRVTLGPLALNAPVWSSFDGTAAALSVAACVLLFRLRVNIIAMLAILAGAGLALQALT